MLRTQSRSDAGPPRALLHRLPPLTAASVLLYALTAAAMIVAVVDYTPGKNPRWVLGLLTLLATGIAAYVGVRGRRFTAIEATALLAVSLTCIVQMSRTTHLDLGALSNGLAMPLLGIYAGWLLPWRASAVYYLGLSAWLVTIWGRHNSEMSLIALIVVGEAIVMTEVVRLLTRRITRLMRTDPLTGTLNRGGIMRRVDAEIELARRRGTPLALAVIDLDDLREVNNASGHRAGDELLARAASEWSRGLGSAGVIGRIGGDEFVVLLPHRHADEATTLLEAVRSSGTVRWTAGVAELHTDDDADQLMERADLRMYDGKPSRPTAR